MPFSPTIDFSVQFDFTEGVLRITDTTNLTGFVAANVQVFAKVTQPDGITRDYPLVADTTGGGTAVIELRTEINGAPMVGDYFFSVKLKSGTEEVESTREVDFLYVRPVGEVTPSLDTFTPSLLFTDTTIYGLAGWITTATTRAWEMQVGSAGVITGTASTLNPLIGGLYYNATYTGTLIAALQYNSMAYAWLSVKDGVTTTINERTYVPPSWTVMQGYLKTMKLRYDALRSMAKKNRQREDYQYNEGLLDQICTLWRLGQTVNLHKQVQDFMNVYYGHVTNVFPLTNAVILPWGNCSGTSDGGTGGGGNTGLPSEFPIYKNNANFLTATFLPDTRFFGNGLRVHVDEFGRHLKTSEYSVNEEGLTILIEGFDATATGAEYNLTIHKVNG